ncbi:V-type sodium ATPase subunit C [bioreactor metagenome]|uniref:V-type sodium ATPase subunit C n=1 Tax=bioreactor metagenome TaxID=1076179 RepID=A0A645HM34_9ZZZZ
MERVLCDAGRLPKQELIASALVSVQKLLDYWAVTDYRECAAMLKISTAEFEKQCDNLRMQEIMSAKYKAFGIDPFIAYYLAKETEIKNMRVILNAKVNNLSSDIIRKRVREMYV